MREEALIIPYEKGLRPPSSIKEVNAHLPDGYELVKGKGYFYFSYPANELWEQESVMVINLRQQSLQDWIDDFNRLRPKKEEQNG